MTRNHAILGVFTWLAIATIPGASRPALASSGSAAAQKADPDGEKTKGTAEKAADATKEAVERAGDATKEAAVKTKDAVVKGTTVTIDKSKDGLSKTGEVMTDAWITARVHARFVDQALLKNSDISVDADNHVVTLTGTVVTRAGRTKATVIAKSTEGVKTVINRLTIGPKRAA